MWGWYNIGVARFEVGFGYDVCVFGFGCVSCLWYLGLDLGLDGDLGLSCAVR